MNRILRSSSTTHSRPNRNESAKQGTSWQKRLSFWLLLGIAAFYLISEHGAHLVENLAWLPLLLIVACPLIHMFGHGHHAGNGSRAHEHAPEIDQSGDSLERTQAPTEQSPDHTNNRGAQSK